MQVVRRVGERRNRLRDRYLRADGEYGIPVNGCARPSVLTESAEPAIVRDAARGIRLRAPECASVD